MENKIKTNCLIVNPSYFFNKHIIQEPFETGGKEVLNHISKVNYKTTIITHCILMLSIFKEEILKKDNNANLILNIDESIFEKILGNLIVKNGDKFQVGEITLTTKLEILELIRNKLLHGDYYIDLEKMKIVLKSNDLEGIIGFEDLYQLCEKLPDAKKFKLIGKECRPIVLYKENPKRPNILWSMYELKKLLKNTYSVQFIEEPEEGFERTPEYVELLQKFYSSLPPKDNKLNEQKITNYIQDKFQEYEDEFKKHHIKIKYNIYKVTSTPVYKTLKKIYKDYRRLLLHYGIEHRKKFIIQAASNLLSEENNDYLILTGAVYNNMTYLSKYILNDPNNVEELRSKNSVTPVEDMQITSLLNLFYSMYHYPLDKILSKRDETNLEDIVIDRYLNFADLNLDKLYDPNMTYDVRFKNMQTQLAPIKQEVIKAKEIVLRNNENLENYIEKHEVIDESRKDFLYDKRTKSIDEYFEKLNKSDRAEQFMNEQYNQYIINYNIIAHIRNALAHGNIRIRPYEGGDPYNNREIIIEDIFKGKMTYRKVIKVSDFCQLFDEHNMNCIQNFINNICYKGLGTLTETKGHTYTKK